MHALIGRARELGWQSVEVSEIYDYNVASRRTYESLGFVVVGDTELGHRYSLAFPSRGLQFWESTAVVRPDGVLGLAGGRAAFDG